MIYTLTVNPSIDYNLEIENFLPGRVNRSNCEKIIPGGKGINVSTVLKNLGIPNIALGFTAGFTGEKIQSLLNEQNITTDFIKLPSGDSRINVKLHSDTETDINGNGPVIDKDSLDKLFSKLNSLSNGDILVLAGSIPSTIPKTLYSDIMKSLSSKGIRFIVDATGSLLMNCLEQKPFLIKPNNFELSEIFNIEIKERKDAIPWAKQLQKNGAQNVLVSMAEKGAILCTSDGQILESDAPNGTVVNSVGAGDSMVAGFLYGLEKTKDFSVALKKGILAGSASTFSGELATLDSITQLENNWHNQ